MSFRLRTLAALLALTALALSGAREAWAWSCALRMDAAQTATMPDMGPMTAPCAAAMAHPSSEQRSGGTAPSKAPPCPFGAMAMSSICASAALLPVDAAPALSAVPSRDGAISFADQTHDLLSASSFFRPPRA